MPQEEFDGHVADPLASALLPVLMHRMNNTTQLLSTLNSLVRCQGGLKWLEERAGDLAQASDLVDDLGYVLAVLASACGADLLLTRRVPRGVEIMIAVVADALRRDGRALSPGDSSRPRQAPNVHGGWELPWAIGALLWRAGEDLESGGRLEWRLREEAERWILSGDHTPRDSFADLAPLLSARLPETELEAREDGWSWRMPALWLSS